MKITIDNISKEVIPISGLTFNQFNEIIIENEIVDLIGYLALAFDLDKDQILNAKVNSPHPSVLHAMLFDVNINNIIHTNFETVESFGETFLTKDLSIDTFGKSYYFEMRKQGKWNNYELSMYGLALAISKTNDIKNVEKIYNELCAQTWTKVLPQAFFLLNVTDKTSIIRKRLLRCFTLGLKKINSKILFYQKKYRTLGKRLLLKTYVKDLISV